MPSRHIREQDPLKQGLKHAMNCAWEEIVFFIREQDPLKQGLKLDSVLFMLRELQLFVSKIH